MKRFASALLCLLMVGAAHADATVASRGGDAVKRLIEGSLPEGQERERRARAFVQDYAAAERGAISRKRVYETHVDALGVRSIVSFLEGEDPHCHGVAHSLGAVVGERTTTLADGMAVCGDACTYACVHGVFKSYFTARASVEAGDAAQTAHSHGAEHAPQGSGPHANHDHAQVAPESEAFRRFTAEATAACREESKVVPGFYQGNCAHAVGHAFGSLAPSVKEANQYCRAFAGREMQYYCETGVFMELGSKIERDIFSAGASPAERRQVAIAYCNSNSRSPSACLRFLLERNRSLAEVDAFAAECAKLSVAHQRWGCFNAMGFFSRTFSVEQPAQFAAVCRHGDDEDRKACIAGVILVKKGHRHEEVLIQGCGLLQRADLTELCEDQSQRSYYQPGNPVMERMLGVVD